MPAPLRLAFLGCGFITRVHSRNLRGLRPSIVCSYASRDAARAAAYCRAHAGTGSFADYDAAIADPAVDAVVVAVPPKFHLELTLRALAAGKHVLVEKPAFLTMQDYRTVLEARGRAGRVVLVGENDHYKPLAVTLRRLLAKGTIGETLAGGDAFFEEGIHWLHVAGSLGPRIVPASVRGYRPPPSAEGPDKRVKSMMVAFQYDNGAAASLYYSREVPSLLKGIRLSKLFGREGIITFESNGAFVLARGGGLPRVIFPGFHDMRGYQAMYRDFFRAICEGGQPEMSVERAIEDQHLMDRVYATV